MTVWAGYIPDLARHRPPCEAGGCAELKAGSRPVSVRPATRYRCGPRTRRKKWDASSARYSVGRALFTFGFPTPRPSSARSNHGVQLNFTSGLPMLYQSHVVRTPWLDEGNIPECNTNNNVPVLTLTANIEQQAAADCPLPRLPTISPVCADRSPLT